MVRAGDSAMKTYHDIEGDGGSDILGQVEAQQASVVASLGGVRHLLAVGSGKGGVGKSTVTMALAQAFRAAGRSVAILDADFNGPCQAHLGGLEGVPWVPGPDGLALPRRADGIGIVSMGSVFPQGQAVDFDSVSRIDQFTWRATKEFAILGQLLASVAWGKLDVLLFDLPPGAERTLHFAEFLGNRASFVLVTIPSDISRAVVARSVDALQQAPGRVLGYVENMAGYLCHGCGEVRPLFGEGRTRTERLALPCLARLPFDPDLAQRCDAGWPSGDVPDSIVQLAERVGDELQAASTDD